MEKISIFQKIIWINPIKYTPKKCKKNIIFLLKEIYFKKQTKNAKMFTANIFENFIISADRKELIIFLMELNFLKKENICKECKVYTKFYSHKRSFDNYAWRCIYYCGKKAPQIF
ncbi:hypothetical protein H311_01116 [Anncaliia algerae PRA109]|nr:hypothetical protein H311_01116 [Anncaliia algerae PRA109]